jgi:hypothetical protein
MKIIVYKFIFRYIIELRYKNHHKKGGEYKMKNKSPKVKEIKKEEVKINKQVEVNKLLKEYKTLTKVSFGRGRQIRRRLRRLGYYLSKQ